MCDLSGRVYSVPFMNQAALANERNFRGAAAAPQEANPYFCGPCFGLGSHHYPLQ